MKKLLPPAYVLGSILSMAALHFLAPAVRLIPSPWNLLGAIPLAVGIAINIVADTAFRRAGTTVEPFKESTSLITTGVYRLSRNPMYLGLVLVVLDVPATDRSSTGPVVGGLPFSSVLERLAA